MGRLGRWGRRIAKNHVYIPKRECVCVFSAAPRLRRHGGRVFAFWYIHMVLSNPLTPPPQPPHRPSSRTDPSVASPRPAPLFPVDLHGLHGESAQERDEDPSFSKLAAIEKEKRISKICYLDTQEAGATNEF